jgi:hypothetical protein
MKAQPVSVKLGGMGRRDDSFLTNFNAHVAYLQTLARKVCVVLVPL